MDFSHFDNQKTMHAILAVTCGLLRQISKFGGPDRVTFLPNNSFSYKEFCVAL